MVKQRGQSIPTRIRFPGDSPPVLYNHRSESCLHIQLRAVQAFEAILSVLFDRRFNRRGIFKYTRPALLERFGRASEILVYRIGSKSAGGQHYLVFIVSKVENPLSIAWKFIHSLNLPLKVIREGITRFETYCCLPEIEAYRYRAMHPDQGATRLTEGREILTSHPVPVTLRGRQVPFVACLYRAAKTRTPGFYRLEVRYENPEALGRIPKEFRRLPPDVVVRAVQDALTDLVDGFRTVLRPRVWKGWTFVPHVPRPSARTANVLACDFMEMTAPLARDYLRPLLTARKNHAQEISRARQWLMRHGLLERINERRHQVTDTGRDYLGQLVDLLLPGIASALQHRRFSAVQPAVPLLDPISCVVGRPPTLHNTESTPQPQSEAARIKGDTEPCGKVAVTRMDPGHGYLTRVNWHCAPPGFTLSAANACGNEDGLVIPPEGFDLAHRPLEGKFFLVSEATDEWFEVEVPGPQVHLVTLPQRVRP